MFEGPSRYRYVQLQNNTLETDVVAGSYLTNTQAQAALVDVFTVVNGSG